MASEAEKARWSQVKDIFADHLRAFHKKSGPKSRADFAPLIGISEGALRGLENREWASPDVLLRIREFLRLSPAERNDRAIPNPDSPFGENEAKLLHLDKFISFVAGETTDLAISLPSVAKPPLKQATPRPFSGYGPPATPPNSEPSRLLSVVFDSNNGRRQDVVMCLRRYQEMQAKRPLAFITHFPSDARQTLVQLWRHLHNSSRRTMKKQLRIQWVYGDKILSLNPEVIAVTLRGAGQKGLLFHGILNSLECTTEGIRKAAADLNSSPPTLFLVDLSAVEMLQAAYSGGVSIDVHADLGRSVSEFCEWISECGHQAIVGLPRGLQILGSIRTFISSSAEVFTASDLYCNGFNGNQSLASPSTVSLQGVTDLFSANSSTLNAIAFAFLQRNEHPPGGSFIRERTYVELATHLFQEGFWEVAYRLELYVRTRESIRNLISLDADIITDGEKVNGIVALLEGVENAPAVLTEGVITGEAGSGKTSALYQVEHQWALPRTADQGLRFPPWLPIYIPFDGTDYENLNTLLRQQMRRNSALGLPDSHERFLLSGHRFLASFAGFDNLQWLFSSPVMLLFDAVDRVADAKRKKVTADLCDLRVGNPAAGMIVATRDAAGLTGTGRQLKMRRLRQQQFSKLVARSGGHDTLTNLLGAIDRPIAHAILNPFLLTKLCDLWDENDRIEDWNLSDILNAWVTHRVRKCHAQEKAIEIAEDLLPRLAANTLSRSNSHAVPHVKLDASKVALAVELGFMLERAEDDVQFAHSLLLDFFGAKQVAWEINQKGVEAVDEFLPQNPGAWGARESMLRALIGLLRRWGEKGRHLINTLIEHLGEQNPRLAHLCLLELPRGYGMALKATKTTGDRVVQNSRLKSLSIDTQDDLEDRIAAAEALGFLDPRIANESPLEGMCRITLPGGHCFWIGKYPVTNLEFSRFIADGGYHLEKFWNKSWSWLRRSAIQCPRFWHQPHFNKPNYPVVGVSVFEGLAYCRWLNQKHVARNLAFAVPTQGQWDLAAGIHDVFVRMSREIRNRTGPLLTETPLQDWRDLVRVLEKLSANVNEAILRELEEGLQPYRQQLNSERRAPIGLFSPNENGCYDMFGNNWEWCDEWLPEIENVRQPSTDEANLTLPVIVKGGPAKASFGDASTVIGGWFDPGTRFHRIGFRICAIEASNQPLASETKQSL